MNRRILGGTEPCVTTYKVTRFGKLLSTFGKAPLRELRENLLNREDKVRRAIKEERQRDR